jgi:hypothetical protein
MAQTSRFRRTNRTTVLALNIFKMFGFVQSEVSQLLKYWPKTSSNDPISANNCEHVRTLFGLFVCPTTEHSPPLSTERGNCSWDRLGGQQKKIVCRGARQSACFEISRSRVPFGQAPSLAVRWRFPDFLFFQFFVPRMEGRTPRFRVRFGFTGFEKLSRRGPVSDATIVSNGTWR